MTGFGFDIPWAFGVATSPQLNDPAAAPFSAAALTQNLTFVPGPQRSDLGTNLGEQTKTLTNGQTSKYTVTVRNAGPDVAKGTVVSGAVDKSLIMYTGARVGKSLCTNGAHFVCALGDLPVGAKRTITFEVIALGGQRTERGSVAVKVASKSKDAKLQNNVSHTPIVVHPATASHGATAAPPHRGLVAAASGNSFLWGVRGFCGPPGSGNFEAGMVGVYVTAEELGLSGTTHFDIAFHEDEQDTSGHWHQSLQQEFTYPFRNDRDSYHVTQFWGFSFTPNEDSNLFRETIRIHWVHDRSDPFPDQVLYKYPQDDTYDKVVTCRSSADDSGGPLG